MVNFANLLRKSEEHLNSDANGREFGYADVYDESAISIKPDKIPVSRVCRVKITIGGKVKL